MERHLKRCIDVIAALASLMLLFPLFLVSAAGTAISLGKPVLFTHERAGYHGHIFRVIKFRTMNETLYSESGREFSESERMTRFSAWMRATGIDELPQLINVIRGEMSLVGPRPLQPDYLPMYSGSHARRHDVLPGITGLAQIQGRQALEFERRFDLDVWYVDNWSLILDFKILLMTTRFLIWRNREDRREAVTGSADWTGYNEQSLE